MIRIDDEQMEIDGSVLDVLAEATMALGYVYKALRDEKPSPEDARHVGEELSIDEVLRCLDYLADDNMPKAACIPKSMLEHRASEQYICRRAAELLRQYAEILRSLHEWGGKSIDAGNDQ